MVEIVLVVALVILPVTLVVILFGKDIKQWMGSTFGSARSESRELYRERSGKAMGAVRGPAGAAGTGSGGEGAAPVQSTSKAPSGDGGVAAQNQGPEATDEKPASWGLAAVAVVAALLAAFATTAKRR